MQFTKKRILMFSVCAVLAAILMSSVTVSATNVEIDSNVTVSPSIISFGTVFPGEVLLQPLIVSLSNSFLADPVLDDVEYHIAQKPKPRIDSDIERAYCDAYPNNLERCYPSLCAYLSKTADAELANDTSIPAFHDPNATTSVAYGRLAKSNSDTNDNWIIDLHAPCIKDSCAQDDDTPAEYVLDPSREGIVLGCDLDIVIDHISTIELEGTIGFWKNWDVHKTYAEANITSWLSLIDVSSKWLMVESGYSVTTGSMMQLINDAFSCNGLLTSCAKKKFLAQYMVIHLNLLSGRKAAQNTYSLTSAQQTYLGLGTPAKLSDVISNIEAKSLSTRGQFLLMQSLLDLINNTGA